MTRGGADALIYAGLVALAVCAIGGGLMFAVWMWAAMLTWWGLL